MKYLNTVLVIAFLSITSVLQAQWWGGKGIKGNGKVTTITRSVGEYDGIKCAGSMDFKLVEGNEGSITIKGDSNLLEYIVTEVKDGNLVVKVKKGKNLKPSNQGILITIPYSDIDSVSLAGSGDVWNDGTIKANEFSTALAGSGDIILNIASNSVSGAVSGSGDLTLKGQTKRLKVAVSGSGDIHGYGLDAVDVDAAVAGSGDISVNCSGALKARVAGSGDIEYRGNPTSEDTKVSGSGSISN